MKQVRITQHERREWMNPVEEQRHIMDRLRNAGIPVIGSVILLGLEYGRLTMEHREGGLLFTWKG